MFSRLSLWAAVVAMTLAKASVLPRQDSTCSTGQLNCCDQVGDVHALGLTNNSALIGVVLDPITAIVGVDCVPVSVLGAAGGSCSAQTACCSGNTYASIP
ncbi:hypothetical protein CPB83DRAFT_894448 [Crepidotus variabilis]|uniref:Hydrophobin n=1 Tax=Crepidotus variabilis TaxID=179855 RepID=A0A9P6EGE6_9AGAR|nr:hypothetical protein CPB83DRAFT_894448 [Crepidotus variabilis]